MLTKSHRLVDKRDFQRVYQKGRLLKARGLGLKCLSNHLKKTRMGVVVSLKISKKAVLRNKIKRQIKEILGSNLKKIKKGYDILIFTYPEITNFSFTEIRQELEGLLSKAGIIQ